MFMKPPIQFTSMNRCLMAAFCLLIFIQSFAMKELKVAVVHYNSKQLILPGSSFPIGIQLVSLQDGEEIIETTKGFLHGRYPWRKLRVKVKGGHFYFGKIHVSNDLKPTPGQFVEIEVRIKKTGQV